MRRTQFILTLLFLLAVGAGVVVGMLVSRAPAAASGETAGQTPLGAELGLTREQTEKMRAIWEGARDKADACFLQAQQAQKRRDDALVALLTEKQKERFNSTLEDYNDELAALKAEREAMFQEAVRRTEQILNQSQKMRYRQILDSRLGTNAAGAPPDWMSTRLPASRPGLSR